MAGGATNEAAGIIDSVSGGLGNKVESSTQTSWIGGGFENSITGSAGVAAIFGGEHNTTSTSGAAIP